MNEGELKRSYDPSYYHELYGGGSISVNEAVRTFPSSGGEIENLLEQGKLDVKVITDESGRPVDKEVKFNKPANQIGK